MTEGAGLLFTVTLDNAVQGAFSVDVTLAGGTATGGAMPLVSPEDYDNVVATLNFAGTAGETQQFTVASLDDALLEGSETFTASLSASNAAITDSDTGTGTLNDNDSAAVTVDDVTVTEGAGLLFTVTLDNAVQGAFSVDVTLAGGTATGGAAPLVSPEDYDNVVATLNFAGTAGETQQFTVASLDDADVEVSETFNVSLNASNPLVTDSDTAIGTIDDNDMAAALLMDCHWNREVMNGEGFDFGSPTAAALMSGISSGVQNTTGDGDEFCNPPNGAAIGFCTTGPAPGHEPPCAPRLTATTSTSCGSFFSEDADHLHRVVIPPGITTLTADTCRPSTDFDTLIVFWNGTTGSELGCFDPPGCGLGSGGGDTGSISVMPGDVVFILIDGFQGNSNGNYELNITGN